MELERLNQLYKDSLVSAPAKLNYSFETKQAVREYIETGSGSALDRIRNLGGCNKGVLDNMLRKLKGRMQHYFPALAHDELSGLWSMLKKEGEFVESLPSHLDFVEVESEDPVNLKVLHKFIHGGADRIENGLSYLKDITPEVAKGVAENAFAHIKERLEAVQRKLNWFRNLIQDTEERIGAIVRNEQAVYLESLSEEELRSLRARTIHYVLKKRLNKLTEALQRFEGTLDVSRGDDL